MPASGPVSSAAWLPCHQAKLAPRCSETPKGSPWARAAFCQSPTTSRCGPICTAFHR
jgi:hypothetical protein